MPKGIYIRTKPVWNKDIPLSAETKLKISERLKGRKSPMKGKGRELKKCLDCGKPLERSAFYKGSTRCRSCIRKFIPVSQETKLRMSERRKGKYKGEEHWNWKNGKSFEKYTVDWTETLKRSIRERDHYTCQWCGNLQGDRALHVHHIDHDKKNCNPKNLISLCISCHITHHDGERRK